MSKSWRQQSNWRTWGEVTKVFERSYPLRGCSCGWGQAGFRGMCECGKDEQLPEVVPEEGYTVHSKDGLLRCGPRDVDRLVRLGDVVRWLVRTQELPILIAMQKVLCCFDGDGVRHVYVVSPENYAHSVGSSARYPEFFVMDSKLPEAPLPLRIASSHAIALHRTWVCNMEAFEPTAVNGECREFPSLAVRISRAHELWGWGRAAASVALPDAVADAPAAPVIEAQDVTDWHSLVRYRLQFASLAAQKRPEWLPEHVGMLAGRLHEEHQAGRGVGALGRLAKELGFARSTVSELLEKHEYSTTTGAKGGVWCAGAGARDKEAG